MRTRSRARNWWTRLHGYAREAGRDPAAIGLEPRLNLATVPAAERADYVKAWQRLGATYLTVATMGAGYATVDDHLGALERPSPTCAGPACTMLRRPPDQAGKGSGAGRLRGLRRNLPGDSGSPRQPPVTPGPC